MRTLCRFDPPRLRFSGALLLGALVLAGCVSPPPEPAAPQVPAPSEPAPDITRRAPPVDVTPDLPAVLPPADTSRHLRLPHMADRGAVRAALLLPLGAEQQTVRDVAQGLYDAAQLALFDFDDPDLVLIVKDTKGDPAVARAAAEEAIDEGAEIILGPLFSTSVGSVGPAARAKGVPVIAFSTDRAVAEPGVYLLSFLPEQEVDRIVDYATLNGLTRLAAFIPQTPYGSRVEGPFREAVAARGAQIVTSETYPQDVQAMQAPAERLAIQGRAGAYDAILLPEGGAYLQSIGSLFPYYDLRQGSVQYLGTGLWNDPQTLSEPNLQGGWFAAPAPEAFSAFTARFRRAYGRTPPRIATLAYDAVSLAAALAARSPGRRYSGENLTNPEGFSGTDGIFRFREDGLNERGLAVLEVRPGGFVVIDPAPTSFRPATF